MDDEAVLKWSLTALTQMASGENRPPRDALAQAAVAGLSWVGTAPAADFLLQKLNAAPATERDQLAATILNVHRPEAKPAFEYAAVGNKSASAEVTRAVAIQALANYPDDATAQVLNKLAQDQNAAIRAAACLRAAHRQAQAALAKVKKALTP